MIKVKKITILEGEWTRWYKNRPKFLTCCDCGLAHKMQFRVKNGCLEIKTYRDGGMTRHHRAVKKYPMVRRK